eukprot:UN21224
MKLLLVALLCAISYAQTDYVSLLDTHSYDYLSHGNHHCDMYSDSRGAAIEEAKSYCSSHSDCGGFAISQKWDSFCPQFFSLNPTTYHNSDWTFFVKNEEASDSSACAWVQSNANTDGEILIGFVNSLDECISMVRSNSQCTDATMANVDTTNGGSYFGSCWCQWGSSMITDNDSCCQTTWIDDDCTASECSLEGVDFRGQDLTSYICGRKDFSAIAFSEDCHRWGVATERDSQQEADEDAIDWCNGGGLDRDGDIPCEVQYTRDDVCGAVASGSSACTWIQSNANTDGEILVGLVNSLDECISMVRSNSQCTDATMANVDTTNGGSHFGSCWCQWGSSMITDNDSCCQTTWIDDDCTAAGYEGSLCKVDDDCDSARCNFSELPSRCRKKESHLSDCGRDVDCESEHCLDRKCVDGRDNNRCNSNDDCQSGRCAFGLPFGKCQTQAEHGKKLHS